MLKLIDFNQKHSVSFKLEPRLANSSLVLTEDKPPVCILNSSLNLISKLESFPKFSDILSELEVRILNLRFARDRELLNLKIVSKPQVCF